MSDPFEAIGFKVTDEASYQALAEEASRHGVISKLQRERATLHGCCWQLGEGLEVWSVLHESKEGIFYADCRPAFRGRYLYALYPWEVIEYEEDGEALVRGIITGSDIEIIFELQNLTEIDLTAFQERPITVAASGLAYDMRLNSKKLAPHFLPLTGKPKRRQVAENDYTVRGEVLSWRVLRNPYTTNDLVWIYLNTGQLRLEVIVGRAGLECELRDGAQLSTEVWLQGYILSERDLEARYEGVDSEIPHSDYWLALRREN